MKLVVFTTRKYPAKVIKWVVLVSTICVSLMMFIRSSSHIWMTWSSATIMSEGQACNCAVYRSRSGDVLLYIPSRSQEYDHVYIVDWARRFVGKPPGGGANLIRMPFFVYSQNEPILTIPLDGSAAKVDQFDAELKIQSDSLTFQTMENQTVSVQW